jgi:hypothetical protein
MLADRNAALMAKMSKTSLRSEFCGEAICSSPKMN